MSRYITPSKISYTALVLIYLQDAVPTDSCVFWLSYVVSSPLHSSPSTLESPYGSKNFDRAILETIQNDISTRASSIPGRTLWDLLLEKLWEIESFDSFHEFFCRLKSKVRQSRKQRLRDGASVTETSDGQMRLSPRSPLGIFLRRMSLEFDRLQLRSVVELWISFSKFRKPTMAMWRKRNPPPLNANLQEIILLDEQTVRHFQTRMRPGVLEWGKRVLDIESTLDFQAEHMQSRTSC